MTKRKQFQVASRVVMAYSKVSIVLLAFLVIFILTVLMNRSKRDKRVVTFSIGYEDFEEEGNEEGYSVWGLLHIEQVLKKAEPSGNLTVVIRRSDTA